MNMVEILTILLKPIGRAGAKVAWKNREQLKTYFKTKLGKYKNLDIRFSVSYLFKIKIPNTNDYLLVLNRRINNQLQPVGGVYKRYDGCNYLFNQWGYKSDNKKNGLNVDKLSESDLRFMIKGKHVIDVIKWFESQSEREVSPEREFREELLDTKILNAETFKDIKYKHLRRFSKNLVWSNYFSCYEVLIYDIFELIPSEKQKQALTRLHNKKNNLEKGYAIVSCDDIEQLRLLDNNKQIAKIGEHSKLLINQDF